MLSKGFFKFYFYLIIIPVTAIRNTVSFAGTGFSSGQVRPSTSWLCALALVVLGAPYSTGTCALKMPISPYPLTRCVLEGCESGKQNTVFSRFLGQRLACCALCWLSCPSKPSPQSLSFITTHVRLLCM